MSAGVRAVYHAIPVPACPLAWANYNRGLGLQIQSRLGQTVLGFPCVRDEFLQDSIAEFYFETRLIECASPSLEVALVSQT